MARRAKSLAWAAVVAAAVLVPLYGDARSAPVTHAEWARMLLRALDMEDVFPVTSQASQAFAVLSWKNSLSYPASSYLRGAGVAVEGRSVVAGETQGDVAYPVSVVRAGDYKLRLEIAGNPSTPAQAEIAPKGAAAALKTFPVVPAAAPGWIDAGSIHLDPGMYMASVLLPPGTSLSRVEVAPPCVSSVEPLGGWKATAVLQSADLAVTVLEALDLQSALPPAATAVEVHGSDFQTSGPRLIEAAQGGESQLWLKAGPSALEAYVFVDLPEAGLYSVSSFGIEGGGQSWLGDACQKAVLCGGAELAGGTEPQWKTVMTAEFTAGRHFFRVVLGSGAGIERVRFERKKDAPEDYVDAVKRVGFDPGPDGPVPRDKAVEAMKFVEGKRGTVLSKPCGDPLTATTAAQSAQAGQPGQGLAQPPAPVPGPPPPPPNAGQGPPPVGPPAIPPQEPASPATLGG